MEKMLLSVRDVMAITELSYKAVLSLAHRTDAPVIFVGRKAYFVASQLESYFEQLALEQAQISE